MDLTIDNALNLAWLAMSVAALAALCACGGGVRSRLRQFFAVLVIALALFPAVSDSDDLFSFSLFDWHSGGRDRFGSAPTEDPQGKAGSQVLRLLESLGQSLQPTVSSPAPVLFYAYLAPAFQPRLISRAAVCRRGRAPPTAA